MTGEVKNILKHVNKLLGSKWQTVLNVGVLEAGKNGQMYKFAILVRTHKRANVAQSA